MTNEQRSKAKSVTAHGITGVSTTALVSLIMQFGIGPLNDDVGNLQARNARLEAQVTLLTAGTLGTDEAVDFIERQNRIGDDE